MGMGGRGCLSVSIPEGVGVWKEMEEAPAERVGEGEGRMKMRCVAVAERISIAGGWFFFLWEHIWLKRGRGRVCDGGREISRGGRGGRGRGSEEWTGRRSERRRRTRNMWDEKSGAMNRNINV
jgi:hypothetical protein